MKKRIKILSIITTTMLLFGLLSCDSKKQENKLELALKLAEDNASELQKVLDHYQNPKDSLKLKAAKFLISNMPYYSWLNLDKKYNEAFKKAGETRDLTIPLFEERKKNILEQSDLKKIGKNKKINYINNQISKVVFDVFSKEINLLNNNNIQPPKRIFDIKYINASYLIENIDLAFKAYNHNSLKLCNNFNEFLEYILPYRVLDEPLEKGKRKSLFNQYKWVQDSLKTKPINEVVADLHYSLQLSTYTLNNHTYPYPGIPSLSQFEATRFGSCDQLATYIVSVLRSVGIPSGIDYSQRWGNYYKNNSHSWVFYLEGGHVKALDVGGLGENLQDIYHQSNITKVFRRTFSKPEKYDVTNMYHDTEDIHIDILWEPDHKDPTKIYLGVFNPKTQWDKVTNADKIENNKAVFKKTGVDLIYVAFYENEQGKQLINYPFEVDKKGTVKYLNIDASNLKKGVVLRKYPIISYTNSTEKIESLKSPNGCILEGRNNENLPFEKIHEIKNFYSSHEINLTLNHPVEYKYYRFYKPKLRTKISTFHLLDNSSKTISNYSNVRFKRNKSNKSYNRLIDNDPLSFVDATWLVINYSFDKPTKVAGIKIQAKNDDNHINKNESYELLYWNKKWVSLGSQIAKDTVLYYNNIPKHALYWLKNKTKGNEEAVFKFDDNGNQVWVGAEVLENKKF